jgi:hypothetical protein
MIAKARRKRTSWIIIKLANLNRLFLSLARLDNPVNQNKLKQHPGVPSATGRSIAQMSKEMTSKLPARMATEEKAHLSKRSPAIS